MTIDITRKIPLLQLQSDALQVLHEKSSVDGETSETVWFYYEGKPYTLEVTKAGMFDDSNGIAITRKRPTTTGNVFRFVKDEESFDLLFPTKYYMFTSLSPTTFTSISQDGDKVMIGTDDGCIMKIPKPTPININSLIVRKDAHYGDVLRLASFASEKVLCSVGLDMRVKVWDNRSATSEFGDAVRVLEGVHTARVSDFALIGRGRNLVTCGYDGKVVIWEVGSGNSVWVGQRVRKRDDPCESIAILEVEGGEQLEDVVMADGRFFECAGKVAICGHRSGTISIWDLGTRLSYGELSTGENGVEKLACVDMDHILVGLNNGVLACYSYDLSRRIGRLRWNVVVEEAEPKSDAGVSFKFVKVEGDSVIACTDNNFVRVSVDTGTLEAVFVGMEEPVCDMANYRGDEMLVVGKRSSLVSYTI